ncbi:glycoside hydrolase family 16 protein [Caldimonas sp. KR1-144]|uniref:glycoside hydrolase family 16 protein n=1 Tax=Caldimonas sp. KR1-144 TaxID=3400911 RepID=UPI003C08A7EC
MRRALIAAALAAACGFARAGDALLFDDFSYPSAEALAQGGWSLRAHAGHPGVPGARWDPAGIAVVDDPDRAANRLLRLRAQTDGRPDGTAQAQICHARKYLRGTYAARVRFRDTPVSGIDGDPVVQTFYAVAPLAHDFDPHFSEVDWEYLANGGWGAEPTRLYAISWQTVRIEPWLAVNSEQQIAGSLDGWHTLVVQVGEHAVRMFLDGRQVARHAGRNVPVVPMSINFNLWFSPAGLLAPTPEPRVWQQDVDWVLHVRDRLLSPAEMNATVTRLRRQGVARQDTVPATDPPLASDCSF